MTLGEVIGPFEIDPSVLISTSRIAIFSPVGQVILINYFIRIESLALSLRYAYPGCSIWRLFQLLPYSFVDLLHLLQLIGLQDATQLQFGDLLGGLRDPQRSLLLSAALSHHLLVFMHFK